MFPSIKFQANPLECNLCKILVKELDKLVETNETKIKINETVFKVCSDAPGQLKNFVSYSVT